MSEINISDKVIWIGDPRHLKATVVDLIFDPWTQTHTHAKIEFEDVDIFPRTWMTELSSLKKTEIVKKNEMDGCECGLKYCRHGGKHSDWCRLYRKED